MSEAAPEATPNAPAQETQPPTKPETDWKAEAKKWEVRAKENKTAAERLTALEESQKTEQQKLADRATAAEKAAAEAQHDLMRLRVITETGLPADLHEFVTGADEDELRVKATKLKAQFGAEQRTVDVGLGSRQSAAPVSDMNALIRQQAAARRGA